MRRVHEIDEELFFMGATDEYCRDFFRTGGGVCELVVGNRCKRHRACRPPLPPGKMCMAEFGQRGLELRQQAGDLRARNKRLLREWGQTKEDRLDGAEQRKREEIKNEILHVDKEWLALLGERLELLSHEPIDAGEFHSTLTGLLTEKIRLLEFVKLGPDERESAPAGGCEAGTGRA